MVLIDLIDLFPNNFRYEILRFRARRSKNYEAYRSEAEILRSSYDVGLPLLE